MLDLNSVILFSENPAVLVDFYKKILGSESVPSSGEFSRFRLGHTTLVIGHHSKIHGQNSNSARIILNMETKHVEKEFEKMEKNGAAVITRPYHPKHRPKMTVATLADPDNNYFQLISPMHEND